MQNLMKSLVVFVSFLTLACSLNLFSKFHSMLKTEKKNSNGLISDIAEKNDTIGAKRFHHIELYCGDAVSTYKYFIHALGFTLVAKSDMSTGNKHFASYVIQSGKVQFVVTAPYGNTLSENTVNSNSIGNNKQHAREFIEKHGVAVYAVAIEVRNVSYAYEHIMDRGGKSIISPRSVEDDEKNSSLEIAEVQLYGDVVLRLVNSSECKNRHMPNYKDVFNESTNLGYYGIERIDHVVGNLWSLKPTVEFLKKITGFHEFAEFTTFDVGTVDSGLNSIVLSSGNEHVLLPLNEPTFGTRRKSQIQTFLEQNQGEGVQHIALKTNDIFRTLESMNQASPLGGFEFMEPPQARYYQDIKKRLGNKLTKRQYALIEKYGILADCDEEGVLLQIFTKPITDRSSLFIEIIQRIGCTSKKSEQKPGCGGFGKGNFRDLFKSIEEYEKQQHLQ